MNADPDILHLDNVDSVLPGQTVVQTPLTGMTFFMHLERNGTPDGTATCMRHHLNGTRSLPFLSAAFAVQNASAFSHHHCMHSFRTPTKEKSQFLWSRRGFLSDLRAMPDDVLGAHASLYLRAETDGQWPEQVLVGPGSIPGEVRQS